MESLPKDIKGAWDAMSPEERGALTGALIAQYGLVVLDALSVLQMPTNGEGATGTACVLVAVGAFILARRAEEAGKDLDVERHVQFFRRHLVEFGVRAALETAHDKASQAAQAAAALGGRE